MEDLLRTYLHDHLGGSKFAIELLEAMAERYRNHETGAFAAEIVNPIREDRSTLEGIIDRVGRAPADFKDAAGWLAEKMSRSKLQENDPEGFGPFQALEALSLGVLGKRALWRALAVAAASDPRVAGYDHAALAGRAEEQFTRVEAYRLRLAQTALMAPSLVPDRLEEAGCDPSPRP